MSAYKDPTFDRVLVRQLRAQNRSCRTCTFNRRRHMRRRCTKGHGAYPEGPCKHWEERTLGDD